MQVIWIPGWGFGKGIWQNLEELLQSLYPEGLKSHNLGWQDCPLDLSAEDRSGHWQDLIPSLGLREGEETVICGWSLGAMLSLDLVHSLLLKKPEGGGGSCLEVNKLRLLLFSPSACMPGEAPSYSGVPAKALEMMRLRLSRGGSGAERVLRDFSQNCNHGSESLLSAEELERLFLAEAEEQGTEALLAGLSYLQYQDLREKLAEISSLNIPSLVLHGKEDKIIPVSQGEFVAHNLASQCLFMGLGHNLFLPQLQDSLSKALEGFLMAGSTDVEGRT